jgi:hypothetical protein
VSFIVKATWQGEPIEEVTFPDRDEALEFMRDNAPMGWGLELIEEAEAVCQTCGGTGFVYPHPDALTLVLCPSCNRSRP